MTTKNLADLEALLLSIKDEEIRNYTQEAVDCYKSQSYRSAIISIWIAVVTDLYKKTKVMAEQYKDRAALQILEEINNIHANDKEKASKWEQKILLQTKDDLKIISNIEYDFLSRLESDRHKCAHPVFYKDGLFIPTAELVRVHIRSAIEYVLSQKPIIGKNYANLLLEDIKSPFFPSDSKTINEYLHEKYLKRAEDVFLQNSIKLLLKTLLVESNEELSRKLSRSIKSIVTFNTNLLSSIGDDITSIINRLSDDKLFNIAMLIANKQDFWMFLPKTIEIKLKEFLKSNEINNIGKSYFINLDKDLFESLSKKFLSLSDTEKQSFIGKVEELNLQSSDVFSDLKERLIDNFMCAGRFADARSYANDLSYVLNLLTQTDILKIINMDYNNQLIDVEDLFISLYKITLNKYPELLPEWANFKSKFDNMCYNRFFEMIDENIMYDENIEEIADEEIPF